jgi:hypothetical protein
MTQKTGFMILNPGPLATPLNFRAWLRSALVQYDKEQGQLGVVALLFVSTHYVSAIGRKKLEKMLHGAVQKYKWLKVIELMVTPKTLSDDEAEVFVEELLASMSKGESDVAGIYLGYERAQEQEPGKGTSESQETPVCIINRIKESDLPAVTAVHSNYAEGDWSVVGEIDNRQALSHPLKTLEEAMQYGRDFFGVKRYMEPLGDA